MPPPTRRLPLPPGVVTTPPYSAGFQKFLLADVERANTAHGAEGGDRALVDVLKDTAAFSWALECVLSRAFQLPPDKAAAMVLEQDDDVPARAPEVEPSAPQDTRMALVPFIDSMNHYTRMPTHMYWEADGAISLAGERTAVVDGMLHSSLRVRQST